MPSTITKARAINVRNGDQFQSGIGRVVWTAVSDARVVAGSVIIDVRHEVDGALETREFDRDQEWSAHAVHRA